MFYTYDQNNSGGRWVEDDAKGIAPVVIVEAPDLERANIKAEQIGIYFDGVAAGIDCECCGDRWYEPYDGTELPEVYGDPVWKYVRRQYGRKRIAIHTLDDKVVWVTSD